MHAGDGTGVTLGRKLLQFDTSLYDQLTTAILNGDISAAQSLIAQGSRRGQTGAIATALSTAAANVSSLACQCPCFPAHLLLQLAALLVTKYHLNLTLKRTEKKCKFAYGGFMRRVKVMQPRKQSLEQFPRVPQLLQFLRLLPRQVECEGLICLICDL